MGLAGMSLGAAIPGAVCFAVLLMAVLKSLEPMPTILKVTAIMTLLVALMMTLFPLYILIWYRSSRVVLPKAGKGKGAAAAAVGGAAGAALSEGELPVEEEALNESFMESFGDGLATQAGGDDALSEEFDEFAEELSSSEVEAVDSGELEEHSGDEDFEFEEFEEDEEQ
jgi:hypothetical protein